MSTYAPAPAVYDLSDEIKESDATASEETLAHKIAFTRVLLHPCMLLFAALTSQASASTAPTKS
jgi:hypothetical protein